MWWCAALVVVLFLCWVYYDPEVEPKMVNCDMCQRELNSPDQLVWCLPPHDSAPIRICVRPCWREICKLMKVEQERD